MIGIIINRREYPSVLKSLCMNENLIFVVIPEAQFKILNSLRQGKERINYFNSQPFTERIIYKHCMQYDVDKNEVYIGELSKDYFKLFFETLSLYFKPDVAIVTEYKDDMLKMGFKNPTLCGTDQKVCLKRKNSLKDVEKVDPNQVKLDLEFLKAHINKDVCNIFLQVDQRSLDFMLKLVKGGLNGKEKFQKEYFGSFKISQGVKKGNKIIYTLSVDEKSVLVGKAEETDAAETLYNFHSHPVAAYKRHKVKTGVPSVADYSSVYILSKTGTIIHFVAALEGIYTISMNPKSKYLQKPAKELFDFIEKNFRYNRNDIPKYLEYINNFGLFHVDLIPYKPTLIEAFFHKQGKYKNCVIHE